ncbi:MAG: dynamin family protein [Planctomycetia bacterium]|nr:dynamin family protein [Planctomycetia bacterium]
MDISRQVDAVPVPEAVFADPQVLQKYMRLKLAVTRQLQFLERLLQVRDKKHQEANCRQLLTKLAEDRFTLAVVGQFKRGKSSLINALIGQELLPTGLLPLTSTITILRFGARPLLVIQWMNSSLEAERPVSALPEFVTEHGNPGNCKQIRAVYVETNSPFLRRGIELVDTPGIGSAIEANTITTESFIPSCDAVVFVTAVDTPMTGPELEFLRRLRHDVKKIFCVVNKTDMLAEPQLSQVMEFVHTQIKSCLGPQTPIFPVSARPSPDSLTNGEKIVDSVAPLRNTLAEFLASERADILLRVVIEKSLRLLAFEYTDMSVARNLATEPEDLREEKKASIKTDFRCIHDTVAHRIESLTADLVSTTGSAGIAELRRNLNAAVASVADNAIYTNLNNRWKSYHHVLCIIAPLAARTTERILNQWLVERQAEVLAGIRRWPPHILQAIEQTAVNDRLSVRKVTLWPMSPDDSGIFSSDTEPRRLSIQYVPWTLAGTLGIRYLPTILIRRHLRRLLRLQTLKYTARLKVIAVEQLGAFIAAQIKEFSERLDTALRVAEKNLYMDIHFVGGGYGDALHTPLEEQIQTADRIQKTLMSLLASVTGQTEVTDRIIPAQDGECKQPKTVTDIFTVTIHAGEVWEALRFTGCPVCRRLQRLNFDVLAAWQYRIAVDDAAQQWYAQGQGFCPLHTWQMASISSPQGLSSGYPPFTQRLASGLRAFRPDLENTGKIRQLLASTNSCPLCRLLADAERQFLLHLAAILKSAAGQQRYSASRGVCLRHLPGLLELVNTTRDKRFILDEAAGNLAMLSEDMQSYALKHGTLRRQLINESEEAALTAALEKVAGLKALCFPWRLDEINQ